MAQVSATRSELLARRARIGLATQGRDLLKERRTALVGEFHRLGASALESMDALARDAGDPGRVLGGTVAAAGPEPLQSGTDRGYSLVATRARIDDVAERFEAVLDSLLDIAALELSVRRLADEIARTTRRMNALEHVVLPGLESERAHIALVLEEREMEDRVRLRRVRSKGERR